MPPRRSHNKSRRGCLTCKRRRVKCDEAGPPCTNCRTRSTECQYASTTPANSSVGAHAGRRSASPNASLDRMSLASSRNYTEMQLMHRWTTVTYLSIATEVADDWLIWQRDAPVVALRYDCLMDTIMALTAFEMAHSFPQDAVRWMNVALGYQGSAFHSFRDQLQASSSDEYDAMIYSSVLLMVLAMASATNSVLAHARLDSTIDHCMAHHELVVGAALVMTKDGPDRYKTHPLWSKLPDFLNLEKQPLEPEVEDVLKKMEALNEARGPAKSDAGLVEQMPSPPYIGCKTALVWSRYMLQACTSDLLRSYSLGWLTCCGKDYIKAVKDGDRVALLMMLFWGVLLHPLGKDYWYGKGFGESLVDEVSEAVQCDVDQCGMDVIQWAKHEMRKTDGRKEASPQDSLFGA